MANTGSIVASITARMDSGGAINSNTKTLTVVPASTGVLTVTQSIGTSAAAITLTPLTSTTARALLIQAGASNSSYVKIGTDQAGTKYYENYLEAGEFCVITPNAGETFYAIAGAASQEIIIWGFQN